MVFEAMSRFSEFATTNEPDFYPPAPSGGDQAVRLRVSISQFPPHTLPPSGQQALVSESFGLGASRRPPPGPSKT